jgi:hypothetical protein
MAYTTYTIKISASSSGESRQTVLVLLARLNPACRFAFIAGVLMWNVEKT